MIFPEPRDKSNAWEIHAGFWIFLIPQISHAISIFRTKTIVDEILRSVSFHNNLVASSNIQNWCREATLNIGPYAGGKTRWYFLRLKTSGRCSKPRDTRSPQPAASSAICLRTPGPKCPWVLSPFWRSGPWATLSPI